MNNMKKLYTTFLASLLVLTCAWSQSRSIVVPPNLNGTAAFPFTYLSDFIDADSMPNGTRPHDTYLLQTGGVYFFTAEKTWRFDVHLVATGDTARGKPVVARANKTGGTALDPLYRGFGNFTFDGLYVIMGEEGATAATYETTPFRPEGDNKRFIFNNCVIEKSRQGTIRIEGENSKTYITNCIIRNFGDYERFQGNGRLVDVRDNFADSVVIRNNVVHNILDRMYIGFRQRGLNYFEFSQNTVFNHIGRHGFIQLRNTRNSVIKNNLIMNPSIMGTSPSLSDEQINSFRMTTYLISLDTVVQGASIDMSNNNIFWTQDVLDQYTALDTIKKPQVLSPEVTRLLANPNDAFFTEVLELNNVPSRAPLLRYAREAVRYRDSVGITDIMVEDISLRGTPFDKGYLFDFSRFDPCYSPTARSARAASDGGPLGVRFLCRQLVATREVYNPDLSLRATPNPARDASQLSFRLPQSSQVQLSIFDMSGKKVTDLWSGQLPAGQHTTEWNGLSSVPKGLYFANIQTEAGRMFIKIAVQ